MTRDDLVNLGIAGAVATAAFVFGLAVGSADDNPAPTPAAPAAITETCNQTGVFRIVTNGTSIAITPRPELRGDATLKRPASASQPPYGPRTVVGGYRTCERRHTC